MVGPTRPKYEFIKKKFKNIKKVYEKVIKKISSVSVQLIKWANLTWNASAGPATLKLAHPGMPRRPEQAGGLTPPSKIWVYAVEEDEIFNQQFISSSSREDPTMNTTFRWQPQRIRTKDGEEGGVHDEKGIPLFMNRWTYQHLVRNEASELFIDTAFLITHLCKNLDGRTLVC